MTDGRVDIIDMVEGMPAFPISVHRVLELTADINADPKELVAIIEHDPVLLIRILKLANSPFFRLSPKITSVNHALVIMGFNTVNNMALSVAAIGVLRLKTEAGFDMEGFLLHSLCFTHHEQLRSDDERDSILIGLGKRYPIGPEFPPYGIAQEGLVIEL